MLDASGAGSGARAGVDGAEDDGRAAVVGGAAEVLLARFACAPSRSSVCPNVGSGSSTCGATEGRALITGSADGDVRPTAVAVPQPSPAVTTTPAAPAAIARDLLRHAGATAR